MARILFIQNWYVDYQAIGILSACLQEKGHSAELLITTPERVVQRVRDYRYDLIGFSVITGERGKILQMIRNLRAAGITAPMVAGGLDPTFNPDYWEQQVAVDIICISEGEQALVELLDAIDAGRDYSGIRNLRVKKDGDFVRNPVRPILTAAELDRLPPFNYEVFAGYHGVPFIAYMCGRGCPYACLYCFNKAYRDRDQVGVNQYCRMRQPETCIAELVEIKRRYIDTGAKEQYIYFIDSTSLYDKRWAVKFFTLYKEQIGLKYSINACINEIDEEIVALLKATGCTLIRFGLESGDEEFRMNVLNKKITNETFVKNLALLNAAGVKYQVSIMMGFPYETIASAITTIEFCQKLNYLYTWGANLYTAYPETELAQRAIRDGLIDPEYQEKLNQPIYHYNRTLVRTPDIGKIVNLHRFSYVAITCPRLFPLIKKVLDWRPNFLFDLIFDLSYVLIRARIFFVSNMVRHPLLAVLKYSLQNITIRFSRK